MKKIMFTILCAAGAILLFRVAPLQALEAGEAEVGVLSETSFVVVEDRGADDSSVMLYRVVDGTLELLDVLVVDGDFTDVSRPTVRIPRAAKK